MGAKHGDLGRLQENLGYAFRDLNHLKLALTHRSRGISRKTMNGWNF